MSKIVKNIGNNSLLINSGAGNDDGSSSINNKSASISNAEKLEGRAAKLVILEELRVENSKIPDGQIEKSKELVRKVFHNSVVLDKIIDATYKNSVPMEQWKTFQVLTKNISARSSKILDKKDQLAITEKMTKAVLKKTVRLPFLSRIFNFFNNVPAPDNVPAPELPNFKMAKIFNNFNCVRIVLDCGSDEEYSKNNPFSWLGDLSGKEIVVTVFPGDENRRLGELLLAATKKSEPAQLRVEFSVKPDEGVSYAKSQNRNNLIALCEIIGLIEYPVDVQFGLEVINSVDLLKAIAVHLKDKSVGLTLGGSLINDENLTLKNFNQIKSISTLQHNGLPRKFSTEISEMKSLESLKMEFDDTGGHHYFTLGLRCYKKFENIKNYSLSYYVDGGRINFENFPNAKFLKSLSICQKPPGRRSFLDNSNDEDNCYSGNFQEMKCLENFSLVLPENFGKSISRYVLKNLGNMQKMTTCRLEGVAMQIADYGQLGELQMPNLTDLYISSTIPQNLEHPPVLASGFNPFPNLRRMTGDATTVKWLTDSEAGLALSNAGCEFTTIN
ncbi:hypothetical protein [Paraburkholderia hayleyella]|uniref:hypothetical protein n=1 Tax=Paraburkholderia hayleyella TaxID=2152889 RepID=UPI00129235C2|nr:hypothetical protein [Paraburkholderia hayleyella]